MCAIVGSRYEDKLLELVELNSNRGSHSYSFSLYNMYTGELRIVKRDFGTLDPSIVNIPTNHYGIVHVQAPTTGSKDLSSIHPATSLPPYKTFTVDKNITEEYYSDALWHNGILKPTTIAAIQEKYSRLKSVQWDTRLLLEVVNNTYTDLCEVDGTFSCLHYNDNRLVLFRNEISPMFFDSELNISSTKFENSGSTNPNMAWKMEFSSNQLHGVGGKFKTVDNPYYFE